MKTRDELRRILGSTALLATLAAACTDDSAQDDAAAGNAVADYRSFDKTAFTGGVFLQDELGNAYIGRNVGSVIDPVQNIYTISADGQATTCLTCSLPNEGAYGGEPSPDGRWFLFWVGPFLGPELAEHAGAGGTQLYALNLETYRLTQVTFEGFNRVAFWAPDSEFVYWTVVESNLTYHMWEGRFVVEDGVPRLERTREMIPAIPLETDAERAGLKYAWFEAKQVTTDSLFFASTMGSSGNSDLWEMDRETMEVVRLTEHREYEEFISLSPNGEQALFASSRAFEQMSKLVPFPLGPPLLDAYMVIPILTYSISFQVIPLTFESYLMNPDQSDPIRIFETGEERWQFGGVTWSPDSSQLVHGQWAPPKDVPGFLAKVDTRAALVTFALKEGTRAPWPALENVRNFDPAAAQNAEIDVQELLPVALPSADISENIQGAASGFAVMTGHCDLANSAYDVSVKFENFADHETDSPMTGSARAFVVPAESLWDTEMGWDIVVQRENGDWFESHLAGKGYNVTASSGWSVGEDAGKFDVSFP